MDVDFFSASVASKRAESKKEGEMKRFATGIGFFLSVFIFFGSPASASNVTLTPLGNGRVLIDSTGINAVFLNEWDIPWGVTPWLITRDESGKGTAYLVHTADYPHVFKELCWWGVGPRYGYGPCGQIVNGSASVIVDVGGKNNTDAFLPVVMGWGQNSGGFCGVNFLAWGSHPPESELLQCPGWWNPDDLLVLRSDKKGKVKFATEKQVAKYEKEEYSQFCWRP